MSLVVALLLGMMAPEVPAGYAEAKFMRWQALPEALEEAARHQRPVLIYVHAPWCGPCRRMERDVFPQTTPLLDRFALAGLDLDDHEAQVRVGPVTQSPAAWARHFGAEATPAFVLLEPDGTVITRTTGFLDAQSFGLLLAYIATGAYHHVSFEAYVQRTTG